MGSDVVVVDPSRKGLHPSLIGALRDLSSVERKAKSLSESSYAKEKEERRPWILRAREASVKIGSNAIVENNQSYSMVFPCYCSVTKDNHL
ncbi:hypothetical protein HS088_TW12G00777 [Tripterygium wilfordii]|uniref:Uncharacterized protein n=1 Tax=Tripterygium wilfordii TaxID=458696 RepID=A0A7J7CZV9_TRIWF|nr:hypothetical protein HS088_TW12G00777 [Tripterygium wilfordii]